MGSVAPTIPQMHHACRDGGHGSGRFGESEEDVPKLIGKGCKRRGWWKEGKVGRTKGQSHMACWVHVRDNGEAVDARSIRELEKEWLQKHDEDDLGLDVTGLERDYWLGTEAGLQGCHTFRSSLPLRQ